MDNCSVVLKRLVDPGDVGACHDFHSVRQAAACRAWTAIQSDEAATWSDAMKRGWNDVHAKCVPGGTTESIRGTLTPNEAKRSPLRSAYRVFDPEGARVGHIAFSDEELDICMENSCTIHDLRELKPDNRHVALEAAMKALGAFGYRVEEEK